MPLNVAGMAEFGALDAASIEKLLAFSNATKLAGIAAVKQLDEEGKNAIAASVFAAIEEMRALPAKMEKHFEDAEGAAAAQTPVPLLPIPRRSAATLSVEEFVTEYAMKGIPVVITGLEMMQPSRWSEDVLCCRATMQCRIS